MRTVSCQMSSRPQVEGSPVPVHRIAKVFDTMSGLIQRTDTNPNATKRARSLHCLRFLLPDRRTERRSATMSIDPEKLNRPDLEPVISKATTMISPMKKVRTDRLASGVPQRSTRSRQRDVRSGQFRLF